MQHVGGRGSARGQYAYMRGTGAHTLARMQVGLVTSGTYLVSSYVLPAWFTLRILRARVAPAERVLLWLVIPLGLALSAAGLYASVASLVDDVRGGGEGGWTTPAPAGVPHLPSGGAGAAAMSF